MNLSYREAIIITRIINRYLEDHPAGESAEEGREIMEKLDKNILNRLENVLDQALNEGNGAYRP